MSQHYFYTHLVECDNYSDFVEVFPKGFCYGISRSPREGSCNASYYTDTFKGFDFDTYYSVDSKVEFLRKIMPRRLLGFLDPEFDVKTKTVTFFENLDKKNRGIRSNPTKMGKFFRKVCPFFNDKQIEFLVNYTIDYFTDSVYEHNIAEGDKIAEIYLSKAEPGRNVGDYSCINASCMRYDNWQIHPTKVYATESWELHYLTNEEGGIGARALICKEDNTYSYIYASCDHAGNTLEEKLRDLGFTDAEAARRPFDGAKLLKIEGNGGLVAPYIDSHCNVKDCGDYLEITHGSPDYIFNGANGYVELAVTYECISCGRGIYGDEVTCVDNDPYCENCTFFCNHFGEFVAGESLEVYFSKCGSYTVCEEALSGMGAVFNEEKNEWQTAEWFKECKEEDEDGEEDTEIENQPKKEIVPGVKCVVISGYETFHHFPIGTVVEVIELMREGVWNCSADNLTFNQSIRKRDLVVVE